MTTIPTSGCQGLRGHKALQQRLERLLHQDRETSKGLWDSKSREIKEVKAMVETNTSKTSLHYKSQEPDQEGQDLQGPGGHLTGWGTGLQRRKSGHTQGEALDYRSPGDKDVPDGTEAAIILVLIVILFLIFVPHEKGKDMQGCNN